MVTYRETVVRGQSPASVDGGKTTAANAETPERPVAREGAEDGRATR